MTSYEKLIREQDWVYASGGMDWRDGLLLGNGGLGVLTAVPAHLEWVLNKTDIFDPTVDADALKKRLTHAEFLRRIEKMSLKNTLFLNDAEKSSHPGRGIRSTVSAAVLRLRFWHGIGWSAPSIPQTGLRLSLYDGILTGTINAHRFHSHLRMFVPRGTGLFCIRITEADAPRRPHIFELTRPANELLPLPEWHESGRAAAFVQKLPGRKACYAVAVRMVPRGGTEARHGKRASTGTELLQEGDTDIFVSVKSSFECPEPLAAALAEIEAAAGKTIEVLEREHMDWWHRWWDGAYADFGRYREIQKYYTFSLYALACSFDKAPMPGLNGLTYGPLDEHTPGVGYQGYTHDQNAQIPALAFFPANRFGLIEALTDTYWKVRRTLRRETRRLFGCEGIFLPLTMNQLGLEYPTRSYRYTLCGSAYTGMVLSKAWRFSHDIVLLREKLYPLLREFVMFYCALMHKDKNGIYHLDWTVPPEIFTLTRDESATVSMLKVCLETTVEAAELLKRDGKRLPVWKDILAHYPDICKTPSGAYWCGPDVPYDHYFYGGHLLYPFFPAGIDNSRETALKTLHLIENEAVERSFADCAGEWHPNHEWSMFLITSARLRAGDARGGWHGLERFLKLFAKENGLFSHDPILIGNPEESEANEQANADKLRTGRKFCDGRILTEDNPEVPHPICVTPNPNAKRLAPAVLEGSSSFICMASEALLQSHGGIIRLFPCVPDNFTGSFHDFPAEGGFLVSASMKNGKDISAEISAPHGGTFRLKSPDGQVIEKHLRSDEIYKMKIHGDE